MVKKSSVASLKVLRPRRRPVFAALIAALCLAQTCAADSALGSGLKVTGRGSLSYRWESQSGQPAGWGLANDTALYDTRGLREQTDFLLAGDILPGLRLDANIVRSPFSTSTSRWLLTGSLGDAALSVGDITASLDGNPLVSLRRSLKGLKIDGPLGGGSLTMIVSQAKAPVRTDTFYGRNTSGPYYLNSSPVVDGSERVSLDGRALARGHDYFVDYEIGALWFQPALIIAPTSRVTVTYEHLAPGNAGGLTAVRADQSHGRLRVGATYASLRSAAVPSSSPRRDRWTATGTIGPFFLSNRPVVPGSEVVSINGIEQQRDIAYQIDYTEGRITFAFPVPSGALIEVTYRTRGQAGYTGPENMLGLDAALQVSRRASLQASVARSATASGDSAGGIVLSGNASWKALTLQGTFRRASPNFMGLDGSERIDSQKRIALELRPASFIKASWISDAVRQPYLGVFGAQQGPLMVQKNQDLRIEISPRGWPSLTLSRTRRSARSLGDDSTQGGSYEQNTSDGASLAFSRKAFGLSASISSSRASANWSLSTQQPDEFNPLSYDTANRAARFNVWVRPSDRLNISFDGGRSQTSAASGPGSDARGQRFSISYQPSRTLSLSFSGATQATAAIESLSLPASSSRMTQFSLQYTPSARWSAALSADGQTFAGGTSTNSDSRSVSLSLGFRPSSLASLDVQLTRQTVASLGATGRSSNNMVTFNAHLGPWRRLTADFGLQRLNGLASGSFLGFPGQAQQSPSTGSASTYMPYGATATASWRARIQYAVGRRQNVFFEGERWLSTGQPAAGRSESAAVGWEHRLAPGTKLIATLRSMRYRDPSEPRRNWSSNNFDLSLGFDF